MERLSCSWPGKINILKVVILLKVIYKFNAIYIRTPTQFFTKIEAIPLKFQWKYKKIRISKTTMSNKNLLVVLPSES